MRRKRWLFILILLLTVLNAEESVSICYGEKEIEVQLVGAVCLPKSDRSMSSLIAQKPWSRRCGPVKHHLDLVASIRPGLSLVHLTVKVATSRSIVVQCRFRTIESFIVNTRRNFNMVRATNNSSL